MAEEFLLVSRRQLEELRSAVEFVQELYESLLQNAGTVSFPTPPANLIAPTSNGSPGARKKYTVGRGAYSYADVVWKEVEDDTFLLEDVIDQVESLIETTSERWRDSFRRSVLNDERFSTIDGAPGWFMKVRPGAAPTPQRQNHATQPQRVAPTQGGDYDDFVPPPFGDDDDEDNLPF